MTSWGPWSGERSRTASSERLGIAVMKALPPNRLGSPCRTRSIKNGIIFPNSPRPTNRVSGKRWIPSLYVESADFSIGGGEAKGRASRFPGADEGSERSLFTLTAYDIMGRGLQQFSRETPSPDTFVSARFALLMRGSDFDGKRMDRSCRIDPAASPSDEGLSLTTPRKLLRRNPSRRRWAAPISGTIRRRPRRRSAS